MLDYDRESYFPNGIGNIWVRMPLLPATTTSTSSMFMYYGNRAAADGQAAAGVRRSNYLAVWHMREDPSGVAPQILDSTPFHNDATSHGNMPATARRTGAIGDALTFDGSNDYLSIPPGMLDLRNRSFTIELLAWHSYVFAYDQASDTSRILVDGNEVTSGSQGGFSGVAPEIAIGRWRALLTASLRSSRR